MLEQTITLGERASEAVVGGLKPVLDQPPVVKPDGHKGDARTDMFELDLAPAQVRRISRLVTASVAARATIPETGHPETGKRGLGGFAEAWKEYVEFLNVVSADSDC
jgi:hypothetical protein